MIENKEQCRVHNNPCQFYSAEYVTILVFLLGRRNDLEISS